MSLPKNIGLLIIPLPIIILGLAAFLFLGFTMYLKNYGVETNAIVHENNHRFTFTYEYTDHNNNVIIKTASVDRSFYRKNIGAKTLKIKHGKSFTSFSIIENGHSTFTLFLVSIFACAFTFFGAYWMYHAIRIFQKLKRE